MKIVSVSTKRVYVFSVLWNRFKWPAHPTKVSSHLTHWRVAVGRYVDDHTQNGTYVMSLPFLQFWMLGTIKCHLFLLWRVLTTAYNPSKDRACWAVTEKKVWFHVTIVEWVRVTIDGHIYGFQCWRIYWEWEDKKEKEVRK